MLTELTVPSPYLGQHPDTHQSLQVKTDVVVQIDCIQGIFSLAIDKCKAEGFGSKI